MLQGVLPVGQLCVVLLSGLARADKGIGEVVGGVVPDLMLCGGHRLGEIARRLFEIPRLVGGGTRVELDFGRRGPLLKTALEVLQRLLIVPLPVIGETRGGGRLQAETRNQREHENPRRTRQPPTLSQQGPERQHQERCGDGPCVTLDRLAGTEGPALLFLHRDDSLLVDRLGRILPKGLVKPSRLLGDLGQPGGIQLRGDGLAALVAHEVVATILVADRDERPACGAESDREDPDAGRGGLLRRLDAACLEILTIGHQYQRAVHSLPLAESGHRHADGGGNVRSTLRDRVGVEILE